MKLFTLLFCFGTGMLQNAGERNSFYLKPWIWMTIAVVPTVATIAELIFAFKTFRWWGLLISYGFFGLPDFIAKSWGRNPIPFFISGLAAVAVATACHFWL